MILNLWKVGAVLGACLWSLSAMAQDAGSVVYQGESGPGAGKHLVFIASDHEYRGEEVCPALARIFAKHYGFKCTVIFGTDPATGNLLPGSSHVTGLEALKTADLMFIVMRFINLEDDQMQHFVDYVDSGKPIVALRTSTHAFQIPRDRKFAKYSRDYQGEEYEKGFGRQVLGETWVTHYGPNHTTSAKLIAEPGNASHPVLTGVDVEKIWLESGVYTANPIADSTTILARSRVLTGMSPDGPPDERRSELQPSVWVRQLPAPTGGEQRVFTTTHGASRDFLNEDFRRMVINGCLWAVGSEAAIKPDLNIAFVGPYQPSDFAFDGYKLNVKPADLAGWDSPILAGDAPPPRAPRGQGGRGGRRGRGGQNPPADPPAGN